MAARLSISAVTFSEMHRFGEGLGAIVYEFARRTDQLGRCRRLVADKVPLLVEPSELLARRALGTDGKASVGSADFGSP